mmetsp:Transcript_1222/g.2586  ORF Transcript_1222/g.2586 Transcript_1222/m.2586 type:complete len:97 (-) Transcript_1222:76-366(-)
MWSRDVALAQLYFSRTRNRSLQTPMTMIQARNALVGRKFNGRSNSYPIPRCDMLVTPQVMDEGFFLHRDEPYSVLNRVGNSISSMQKSSEDTGGNT